MSLDRRRKAGTGHKSLTIIVHYVPILVSAAQLTAAVQVVAIFRKLKIAGNLLRSSKYSLLTRLAVRRPRKGRLTALRLAVPPKLT